MTKLDFDKLVFSKLGIEGVRKLVKWAVEEGWNPGPFDADIYWATDPNGFYGYFYEGKMIGGGSIVSYNNEFGFMGFFIVKKEYRSLGIGKKLWYQRRDTLLSRLNKNASIGMDGVVAMQPFYETGGFKIAFRDERYVRTGERFDVEKNVSNIEDEDLNDLLAYDKKCFGFSRPQFMIPWLKLPGSFVFKYSDNSRFKGFAVIRKVNIGYKICPLFADDKFIAEELYKACLNAVPDQKVFLDIPVINREAVELVKKFDAKYDFECARMYYGKIPEMTIENVFGITTFELG